MSAVNAEPGLRGVLALAARAGKCELRLAGFDPSPAVLFEARLMMLHDDVMLFSGIEYA